VVVGGRCGKAPAVAKSPATATTGPATAAPPPWPSRQTLLWNNFLGVGHGGAHNPRDGMFRFVLALIRLSVRRYDGLSYAFSVD
jgi:hypothetical protein